MPRKEIDYSKTVIYKIVCNDLAITDLYVGSTINFISRKSQHKIACMKKANYKVYQIINDNGGWENWSMVQIEEYPCANGNEARTRERYWFEELQAKLNMIYPIRSDEEYREANKDKRKMLYANNKDKNKEQCSNYYQANKDKIKERIFRYSQDNKDIIKENKKKYYQENKNRIKERADKYYQENKDKIKTLAKNKRRVENSSISNLSK